MIGCIDIDEFLTRSAGSLLLDVRSPGEFAHAHIPGAVHFPLFTDEERKVVGTAYKQQSREEAIKIGLDYFGVKMRPMVEEVERLLQERSLDKQQHSVLVHCWRGGMRSAGVAWLLDLYGFKVCTLKGGYKAFRNWALSQFELPYNLRVLGGYTGSGKTVILEELRRANEQVIDLEEIAQHRGSAFGGIGKQQPTQEQFENDLALQLTRLNPGKVIWIEDESQRIGQLQLPGALWKNMQSAASVFIEIPFDERLDYITNEYGTLPLPELEASILRIKKKLGGLETKNAIHCLHDGDLAGCFGILLRYYDKCYAKGLNARERSGLQIKKIKCSNVHAGVNCMTIIENYQLQPAATTK